MMTGIATGPKHVIETKGPNRQGTRDRVAAYGALVLVCHYYGSDHDDAALAREYSPDGTVRPLDVVRAARSCGFKAREVHLAPSRVSITPLPLICIGRDGDYFVLAKAENKSCVIARANAAPQIVSEQALREIWEGHAILLSKRDSLSEALGKFDISWFIPALVKYRRVIAEILVVSVFLQIFAIVTPLMFQIVIDRVLAEQRLSTLYVVVGTLTVVSLLEVVMGGLRTHAMNHTAGRIDAELGGKLFAHLLRLPMAYFQSRPSGQTAARVMELESIREFMTGSALTALIDALFIFVLLAAMYVWSPTLTVVVLATLPLYAVTALFVTPVLKRRVDQKFRRHAASHSFLIESITGAETIKSLSISPARNGEWHGRLAAAVVSNLRAATVGVWGAQTFTLVSKISLILVLFVGAREVIAGALTVGSLVAFNMLSQQVAAPVLRMAHLWQDFQEMRISVERLGDILNTPREPRPQSTGTLPDLKGEVRFENLRFSYPGASGAVVNGLDCTVRPGEIVGIVGPSGCGKSTLMRLLQRLYTPDSGRILIDGMDIALLDPERLRQRIGIVLQESYLFSGTVRQNIAQCDPGAPLERIMEAARLAGVHDVIMEMPLGYDSQLEERGQNLSGGQRQRMAIARALMANPSILIMDEATSALDYESELHIQSAMRQIARNRTVLIIAHRLSALRPCERILTLEKGALVQDGPPRELMDEDGFFRRLCHSQMFREAS